MHFHQWKRRDFITLLGGAAAACPLAARAQQPAKLPTIGFLSTTTPAGSRQWISAFVHRLRELGWIEGRTVAIEYRWAEGRAERYAEIAAEFVRLKVDLIVASAGLGAEAAKHVTSAIPIVFIISIDPVGVGLVASLAQPGGNVTGLSTQGTDLAGKKIEILREALPFVRRLAILANVGNAGAALEMRAAEIASGKLGLQPRGVAIRRAEDIAPAFESIASWAEALYVVGDVLQTTYRLRINTWALGLHLPTMQSTREEVEAAGLMSYGPNFASMYRRAADYVDKILRGAKPGDLPVEQPTKFDLIINLTTARALGLEIPESFLLRVDEIIE